MGTMRSVSEDGEHTRPLGVVFRAVTEIFRGNVRREVI
jgi:hypothetical protein